MPNYPTHQQILSWASCSGGACVDPIEAFGFAGVYARLPATVQEFERFRADLYANTIRILGPNAPERNLNEWGWLKNYHYGFAQAMGRLARDDGDYLHYLTLIGVRNPITGRFREGFRPNAGDYYPPGTIATPIQVPPAPPPNATQFTACGQTKTWQQIDSELRRAGWPGPYDHSEDEWYVYINLACRGWNGNPNPVVGGGGGSGGGSSGGQPPAGSPPASISVQQITDWIKKNPYLAAGIAAGAVYLLGGKR